MKCFVSFVCFLSVLVFVSSAPFLPTGGFSASSSLQIGGTGSSGSSSANGGANGLTNILSNIDLPGLLRGVNSFVKFVGVFCPPLSQVLDNVIQNVTSTAFRVFGSAILRSGGLGGGSSGGGQRVNVVLPTFPPDDEDDEDDDDTDVDSAGESSGPITSGPNTFNVDLLGRSGGEESTTTTEKSSAALTLTRTDEESKNEDSSSSGYDSDNEAVPVGEIRLPGKEDSSVNEDSNLVAKRHARVTREAEEAEEDQDGAESAPEPAEDLAGVDDQDRNKRFLPFGGGVEGHASAGSGNFLFDIIRSTADRAARTVGTVYRMVAGTENLGLGLAATAETSPIPVAVGVDAAAHPSPFSLSALSAKLVAGSGATEEHDEKANSPGGVAELDIQKSHEGYSGEGIPGPITRLFVIANRGLANLVQDLILRLAATSEKIVNFKARLITSLI